MRHRLFHAVVIVGAALPGCGSDDPGPAVDAATDTARADTGAGDSTSDSAVIDTGRDAAADSGVRDSAVDAGEEADTCPEWCGDRCVPCIK